MATFLLLHRPKLDLALPGLAVPFVESRPDNTPAQEQFRRPSCFSDAAAGCPIGPRATGYELALEAAA